MTRLFSLLALTLLTCSLTTGCPDKSQQRDAPDYGEMVDPGDEFGGEEASP